MTDQVIVETQAQPQPRTRAWPTIFVPAILLLLVSAFASLWLVQPSYDPARRVPADESAIVPAAEAWLAQHRPALTAQWQACRDGWLPCPRVRDDYFAAVSTLTHSDFGIITSQGPREIERPSFWGIFVFFAMISLWIGGLVARELSPKRRQAARDANAASAAALATKKAEDTLLSAIPVIRRYRTRTRIIRGLARLLLLPCYTPVIILWPLGLPGWLLFRWAIRRQARLDNEIRGWSA